MEGLTFRPLAPKRWGDFEKLFGQRGACGGCWCMLWRMARAEFERVKGEGTRAAMKWLVDAGERPGLLAYLKREPVAWCAVAPRMCYPALERSRVLKRVDCQPVWSISCLFIAKPYRRMGVSVALLKAAADYVRSRGGTVIEGYPVEPKDGGQTPDVFAHTGLASAFLRAGFTECVRRSKTRPVMRRNLG
jgi:GNAT superfamily N-acetyltransferase